MKKHKKIILVIFYLLLVNIFVFSILLGTVFAFNASATAVTFHVFLFALPFLIVDVPIRSDLLIFGVVALFCFFAMKYKDASIRMSDVSNAISFGILSCVLSWVFSRRFMQQYANQLFIEKERDTDGLTRLLTKNASNILMEAYLNSGAYGCCLILDLDNFKAINDRFGHLYGDEVLKRIGKCIVNNTRRVDIVGRFGGDEFIILLTDTNVHEGIKKAYIIMAAIKKEFERDAAHIEKPITCSIGVADSMRHQSYEQLFNAADKALYKAKNAGKNRVEKTE
ncbi:MAG: GGDEF domain-containing protein [Treponema sp.]|nr:GGDEF domain-containing protein [Treponema sp.]